MTTKIFFFFQSMVVNVVGQKSQNSDIILMSDQDGWDEMFVL